MERLPINKMDTWLRNMSPWRKGWEGGKNKGNLGQMEWILLRKLRIDLADFWDDRIHLKRSTPVEKELTWQPQWSRRISTPIKIWEHYFRKRYGINTWHWSNSNTTTQNKTKDLACKISRKQTYDRSHIVSCVCWKDILRATWIPTYKLPKLSGYAIRCWGYRGNIISHPN